MDVNTKERLIPDPWIRRYNRMDLRIATWMNENGIILLRISLGIVFVWFGALKLFKGASPAEPLIASTVTWFDPDTFIPILGVWEILIGIGLIFRRLTRIALLLLFLQMPGAMLPLFIEPEACFKLYPFSNLWDIFVLTIEGQYIIKNLVLISAGIVIGGTVRYRETGDLLDPERIGKIKGSQRTGKE